MKSFLTNCFMVIALLNIGIDIRAQSDLEDRVKKVHRNLSATVQSRSHYMHDSPPRTT